MIVFMQLGPEGVYTHGPHFCSKLSHPVSGQQQRQQ